MQLGQAYIAQTLKKDFPLQNFFLKAWFTACRRPPPTPPTLISSTGTPRQPAKAQISFLIMIFTFYLAIYTFKNKQSDIYFHTKSQQKKLTFQPAQAQTM